MNIVKDLITSYFEQNHFRLDSSMTVAINSYTYIWVKNIGDGIGEYMGRKKDFHWSIDGIDYIVRNVPYESLDADDEELIDLWVAIKLEMIRELMYWDKIPYDVNFDVVADLKFN